MDESVSNPVGMRHDATSKRACRDALCGVSLGSRDLQPDSNELEQTQLLLQEGNVFGFSESAGHSRLPNVPCTLEFRNLVLDAYDLAGADQFGNAAARQKWSLLRLLTFFMPGGHVVHKGFDCDGRDFEYIFTSSNVVREVVKPNSNDSSFSAEKWLDLFSRRIWKLDVVESDWKAKRARTVVNVHYARNILGEYKKNLTNTKIEDLIDLVSGRPFHELENDLHGRPSPVSEIEVIRRYLMSRPLSAYDKILDRLRDAESFVEAQKTKGWNEKRKANDVAYLAATAINPRPTYAAVLGTRRIYPVRRNWLLLSSATRNLVTRDYIKADLVSAQLMISSSKFDFPVDHLLDSQGKVWPKLQRLCGFRTDSETAKGFIKTYMYALLFGMAKRNLSRFAKRHGISGLDESEEMNLLIGARNRFADRLRDGEAFTDAWGETVSITLGLAPRHRDREVRRKMAWLCQSYELALLKPIFDFASERETNGLHIIGLLHDGIYLAGDWAPYLGELQRLVTQEGLRILGNPRIRIDFDIPSQALRIAA